jgi:DNA invertase Pin-like site-specific DNA recombinase
MTVYGYARVSTRDQDLAAQVAELTAAGCAKVYREKVSGAKTDRADASFQGGFWSAALCR